MTFVLTWDKVTASVRRLLSGFPLLAKHASMERKSHHRPREPSWKFIIFGLISRRWACAVRRKTKFESFVEFMHLWLPCFTFSALERPLESCATTEPTRQNVRLLSASKWVLTNLGFYWYAKLTWSISLKRAHCSPQESHLTTLRPRYIKAAHWKP